MKNLQKAMAEEKAYITDRLNGTNTALIDRLAIYGYDDLSEYFKDKREYLFGKWKPEVYEVDIETLTTELENAVQNGRYGIYISVSKKGLYAFHGSDELDYNLCNELGICVAEVFHQGGTIIGSSEDLGIEIVAPQEIGLDSQYILSKFLEIIKKYEDSAVISGNDILINGEKVLGSMQRGVGDAFVWAAQISYGEYDEIIQKVCSKKSKKKAGRIKHKSLNKNLLKGEILKWLQKL